MRQNKILIISSCSEPWGGSEELWNNLAKLLKTNNHNVSLYKDIIDHNHIKIQSLKVDGVSVFSILNSLNFGYKLLYKILVKFNY